MKSGAKKVGIVFGTWRQGAAAALGRFARPLGENRPPTCLELMAGAD